MSERVLNDGVSLKVEDAKQQRDVGRSIARINSDTMRNLNVTTGDVIQIEGKKVTAAKAWPAYTEDQGINMIRIEEFIRNDCDTSIGESVIVTKVEPVEAISVKLAPTETRIKVDNEFLRFVKDRLINRPAIKGDTLLIITLLTTTAHAQQTQIQPRVGHRLT